MGAKQSYMKPMTEFGAWSVWCVMQEHSTDRRKKKRYNSGTGELTMDKLKPCPFCGNQVALYQTRYPLPGFEDVDKGDFEVMCRSCNMATVFFDAKHPIEDMWNRRVDSVGD